ncbi:MAG: ADP-glyceromanno-heptose 6-epimerase [Lentisphaeraceae bacterium]|nr:ADP-glyceromanno-heptose 6-epimerase [Lentisphaeraceae bacterium]
MIVVTGGAGFIGSAIVWAFNKRGKENILIVDNLGTGDKWRNLAPLRYVDYMEKEVFLNLIDQELLPDNISCIIHMGACTDSTESNASYLIANNYKYSETIANYCLDNHIRLIYASSAATYGQGLQGYRDGFNHIEKLRPLTMFGYSKQMFDLWAKRNDLFDEIVGLKFPNVYGPNEYHKGHMKSMVLNCYEQIQKTGKVQLFKSSHEDYADGEQIRDFIYIKDLLKIIFHFIDHPEINGLFNAGSGEGRTWNDLAKAVFKVLEKKEDIEYVDMPENLQDRYQHYTELSMTYLQQTGFKGRLKSLEANVREYIQSYLEEGKNLGDEKL